MSQRLLSCLLFYACGGAMEILKKRILKDGRVISGNILKVDSFLNHQIDGELMKEIGMEFKKRFAEEKITKILTIEASGIAIGIMTSMAFGVPMVFAKKKVPSTMDANVLTTKVFSFTKNKEYDVCMSAEFLGKDDRVLIVDDFLANGHAALGLADLVNKAGAELAGIGIVIEKGFQKGRNLIIDKGIRLESLAIIDELSNGEIKLK